MSTESHRLRSLAFRWEQIAGSACDTYHDYKGKYCASCGQGEGDHVFRQCAAELRALLAEPELIPIPAPPPTEGVTP